MKNKVLRTTGNFPKCTPVRDLHTAFSFPYVHDYTRITKLCRQQAEVTQNHKNEHVRIAGQNEARHRKYKRLKFGGGQAQTVQVTKLPLQDKGNKTDMICSAKPGLTEDLYTVHKEEFSVTCYMNDMYT
jgi:hypothetical protein